MASLEWMVDVLEDMQAVAKAKALDKTEASLGDALIVALQELKDAAEEDEPSTFPQQGDNFRVISFPVGK